MKYLAYAAGVVVIGTVLSFLFSKSDPFAKIDLDLASLELPQSFHEELSTNDAWSDELKRTKADRLRRRVFTDLNLRTDQITYFLLSGDYYHLGGRTIPAIMRVTVKNSTSEFLSLPEYLKSLVTTDPMFGGSSASQLKFEKRSDDVWYAESIETRLGWFSNSETKRMHFILDNQKQGIRLYLSALEYHLRKDRSLELIKKASDTAARDVALADNYFSTAAEYAKHKDAIQKKNFETNLKAFNAQLAVLNLPQLAHDGRIIDVGRYVYGIEGYEGNRWIRIVARIGSKKLDQPRAATQSYLTTPYAAIQDYPFERNQTIISLTERSANLYYPESDAKLPSLVLLEKTATEKSQSLGINLSPLKSASTWLMSPTQTDIYTQPDTKIDYRTQILRIKIAAQETWIYLTFAGQLTDSNNETKMVFWLNNVYDSKFILLDPKVGGTVKENISGVSIELKIEPLNSGHASYRN